MKFGRVTASLLAAVLCGCAGVEFESLGSDKTRDEAARGFRYWQPAPFLFVRSDGQGGVAAEIKWLPDTTQKMSARPYAWGASNQSKLTFAEGVLTGATVTVDETAIVNASLAALSKVLVATAKGAMDAGSAPDGQVPVPLIYKIEIEGDTVKLTGGKTIGVDGMPAVIYATLAK